jgi:hydroxymethylpyrimidine pyrophosphatase-like HAD family hydrolase
VIQGSATRSFISLISLGLTGGIGFLYDIYMAIIIENSDIGTLPERQPSGLFVSDLDGTLLRSDRTFSASDLASLHRLGDHRVVRIVATGRSMFSFKRVQMPGLPIDYVIFSTGAGIAEYPNGKIVRQVSLEPSEVCHAYAVLRGLRLDFMVQRPIPDTHIFGYLAQNPSNPDFETRLSLYSSFAFPLADDIARFGPATQLVAIVPRDRAPEALAEVRQRLTDLTVIQTTSPLDGHSTWIEIFPAGVSKSRTTGWLAARLGIPRERAVSVGNDYNDLDLLEWAGMAFVTANSPHELKQRFPAVASNNDAGVSEAIERWLKQRKKDSSE